MAAEPWKLVKFVIIDESRIKQLWLESLYQGSDLQRFDLDISGAAVSIEWRSIDGLNLWLSFSTT